MSVRRAIMSCVALGAVLSCQQADSVVVVSVTTAPGVQPINQLRALMSNGSDRAVKLYPEQPVASPLDFTAAPITFAVVVPRARGGTFDVAVDGLMVVPGTAAIPPAPPVIATGPGRAILRAGERADVSVLLLVGPPSCGNGALDPGEQCDDGDRFSGDGCDFRCQKEAAGAGGAAGHGGSSGGAGAGGAGGSVTAPGGRGGAPGGAGGHGGSAASAAVHVTSARTG